MVCYTWSILIKKTGNHAKRKGTKNPQCGTYLTYVSNCGVSRTPKEACYVFR